MDRRFSTILGHGKVFEQDCDHQILEIDEAIGDFNQGNTMSYRLKLRFFGCALTACLMAFGTSLAPAKADGLLLLAQAKPAAPAPGTPLPANTTAPGRLYIVEGIVVVLLFAGAIFGVCRSSGRT